MKTVNYGTPVKIVEFLGGWSGSEVLGWRAEHEGAEGHEKLKPGEQCECGCLGIGIVRRDP